MKHVMSILFMLATFIVTAQTKGDNILGDWINEDGSAHFQIYKSNNEYRAKITWLKNGEASTATDKKNPDRTLRSRQLLGLDILTGLTYTSTTNTWNNGRLYGPEKGVYANCSLSLEHNSIIKIVASKYGITKTKTWKRYEK